MQCIYFFTNWVICYNIKDNFIIAAWFMHYFRNYFSASLIDRSHCTMKNFIANLGMRRIVYADTNPMNCQNSIISDRIFQQCWKERKHTHKIVVATYKIPKCWKMATMLLSSSISKSIMCRRSKRLLLSWGNSERGKKSRIFMRSMLTFPNSNCCHATMKLQWISSTGHEIDMKSLMFYSGGTKQNVILYFFPCYTKRF